MSWNFDRKSWAKENFGDCQLGDKRRTKRLIQVAEKAVNNPSGSFPEQMESLAELKGAYRLFNNKHVTFEGIARPHWELTRQRNSGRYLVICDTTELDFGIHRQIDGLGPTGNGFGRGFLLHNALMVNAQNDAIIGIAGQTIHYRKKKQKRRQKESRRQRLERDRESQVWGKVIDDVGPPNGDAEYVYVCDRGADNFEVFCRLQQQQHSEWVIRAKAKNRKILTPEGEETTLGEHLSGLSLRGVYELELRARKNQPARTAKLEVLSGQLQMPVPQHKSPYIKSLDPEPIAMNVVWVREVDAPADADPIEWILYTSLPVDTFEQCWVVIEYYETRWLVEEYHKALKSGCRVTSRQLKDAGRLEAAVGLLSVVALCLLQLKSLARSEPNRPARSVVPTLWLQMLKAARPRLRRVHDLTIAEFYREVAKLGGFLGRKSDGAPGWITIWRGWEKLSTLVRGAELAIQLKLQPTLKKCG